MNKEKILSLNSNQIKMLAIIAMTIDHLTWVLFPGFQTQWCVLSLHIIGRLTAPIMWFFIAEGCHYTHNMRRYITRLFAFAFISHFAYNFAFGIPFIPFSSGAFNQTSIMWSLAWAAVLINIERNEIIPNWGKYIAILLICVISFPSDWSCIAVMCPLFIYINRNRFISQAKSIVFLTTLYAVVYFIFFNKIYGVLQMCTFFAIPILSCYNGKRGTFQGMKWFFYIYYPAHLVIIGIIRLIMHGDIALIF